MHNFSPLFLGAQKSSILPPGFSGTTSLPLGLAPLPFQTCHPVLSWDLMHRRTSNFLCSQGQHRASPPKESLAQGPGRPVPVGTFTCRLQTLEALLPSFAGAGPRWVRQALEFLP